MPVIFAAVLGAVAGPAVGWLERHRVPRIGGAILVLLGLVCHRRAHLPARLRRHLRQSSDISAKLNEALDKIQGWIDDLGVDNAQSATDDVKKAAPRDPRRRC